MTAALIARWRALGLPGTLVAAIPNARAFGQPGLHKGLFDLLVLGPKIGAGFIELKTATGKLRAEQAAFKLCLIANNVPYAVTFGLDEAVQALEAWGIVRQEALP